MLFYLWWKNWGSEGGVGPSDEDKPAIQASLVQGTVCSPQDWVG